MPTLLSPNDKKFTLTEKIDETPEVEVVRFRSADGQRLQFYPGMFIMIYGIDTATGKPALAKAFSIASIPDSDMLELFIVKQPGHTATTAGHVSYFYQASVGQDFYIRGEPQGQFRFDPRVNKKVLFLAGGTGLAPFMSMLRFIKEKDFDCDVALLYSIKFPTEVIRKQELSDLAASLKLKTTISVTRPQPNDGWKGETGHIDAGKIKRIAPDFMERSVYVCGPLAFVTAMRDALKALNVPAENIKVDVWG